MKKHWIFDTALLLAVLLAAGILYAVFSRSGAIEAQIVVDGVCRENIDLASVTEAYELTYNGSVIRVENGRIAFVDAVCPDKTCQKSGWLQKAGQTAACVPHKVVIVLKGTAAVDGVTG